MKKYLLSTYAVEGVTEGSPSTPEEMQAFMARVAAVEAEMDESGTFVFGGALAGPDAATVVRYRGGDVVTTDGPFAESKEMLGGFYIINADSDEAALDWAGKVSDATRHPIEVRPFAASGRVKDHSIP